MSWVWKVVVLYLCIAADIAYSSRNKKVSLPYACGDSFTEDGATITSPRTTLYSKTCRVTFRRTSSRSSYRLAAKFTGISLPSTSDITVQVDGITYHLSGIFLNNEIIVANREMRVTFVNIASSARFDVVIVEDYSADYSKCGGEFNCGDTCIDDDLKCDGINHCFRNNRDEQNCHHSGGSSSIGSVVGGIFSIIIVIAVVVVVVKCIRARRFQARGRAHQTPQVVTTYQTSSAAAQPIVSATTTTTSYPAQTAAYPVGNAAYPPAQANYPPQAGGYPPPAGGYPPPAGGYPPPAGGYPPPAGGYPPPAGGYPPPAGGYPPQAGAYPPPAGGYPPPAGGGYPPPAGGAADPMAPPSYQAVAGPYPTDPMLGGKS